MLAYYFIGSLAITQGILSLVEGIRYFVFVRRSPRQPTAEFTPRVEVIAPCKGVDPGFEDNLAALFDQEYPAFEITFVVASIDDDSTALIERAIAAHPGRARLIVARPNKNRSEKVNNLLFALEHLDPQVEVLVFFDSDARVTREWLNALVAPLADAQVGATTGYRWYLPRRGGFRSALLSAWNGAVATTLGDHKRNFAWGGSTAVLRETFDRIGVREGWQGAVSDDYSLTEAVQRAGLAIKFVPCCLVVSREDATLASLLEFTTRQVAITRVYRPRAWWLGLCSHVLFAVALSGGMTLLLAGVLAGDTDMASAILLALIYLLGSIKGVLRLAAAGHALPDVREELARLRLMYWFGWPLVSLVFLYNFVRSAVTRRITWRGVVYEMTSPTDTVVIR